MSEVVSIEEAFGIEGISMVEMNPVIDNEDAKEMLKHILLAVENGYEHFEEGELRFSISMSEYVHLLESSEAAMENALIDDSISIDSDMFSAFHELLDVSSNHAKIWDDPNVGILEKAQSLKALDDAIYKASPYIYEPIED